MGSLVRIGLVVVSDITDTDTLLLSSPSTRREGTFDKH